MELRIDPNITTSDAAATIEDIYSLHNAKPGEATGDGMTVAVMDTGVDPNHPVFENTNVTQHDFTGSGKGDAVGHGTGCAGLITQLAPDVDIISLRVFGGSGRTGMKPIAKAYDWLINNADKVDICNFSWGAQSNVKAINRLHQKVISAGVRDVVAAGNTGKRGGSPSTAQNAFSVGALTEEGKLTRFSSYNPDRDNPDVAAIGKDVKLARAEGTSMGKVIDDNWTKASGTSFSAPITAGLVARYLSQKQGGAVKAFESSARNIEQTPRDGEGIVDYKRAISGTGGSGGSGGSGGDSGSSKTEAPAVVWDFLETDVVHIQSDFINADSGTAIKQDDGSIRIVPDSS